MGATISLRIAPRWHGLPLVPFSDCQGFTLFLGIGDEEGLFRVIRVFASPCIPCYLDPRTRTDLCKRAGCIHMLESEATR